MHENKLGLHKCSSVSFGKYIMCILSKIYEYNLSHHTVHSFVNINKTSICTTIIKLIHLLALPELNSLCVVFLFSHEGLPPFQEKWYSEWRWNHRGDAWTHSEVPPTSRALTALVAGRRQAAMQCSNPGGGFGKSSSRIRPLEGCFDSLF